MKRLLFVILPLVLCVSPLSFAEDAKAPAADVEAVDSKSEPAPPSATEPDAERAAPTPADISGEVKANKVVLTGTAKVKGDIALEILEVEEGALVEGQVTRLTSLDAEPMH